MGIFCTKVIAVWYNRDVEQFSIVILCYLPNENGIISQFFGKYTILVLLNWSTPLWCRFYFCVAKNDA